jgi:hypothetical protein
MVKKTILYQRLPVSDKLGKMLKDSGQQVPVSTVPFRFSPNSDKLSGHTYFSSTDPNLNEVLGVLNRRISSNPDLETTLKSENSSADLRLQLFPTRNRIIDGKYTSMKDEYGGNFFPTLTRAIRSGENEFLEKEDNQQSPFTKLNRLMGSEFSLDSHAFPNLQEFLSRQLGYGITNLIDDPQDKKIVQNWRVRNAAEYARKRATTIQPTWAEWKTSAGISTGWSIVFDVLAKNAGLQSLFRSELRKTDFKRLPKWRKLLLGIPEGMQREIVKSTTPGKRTGAVAIGVLGQATAEVPDVLLVQGAIQRAGDENMTAVQGFLKALANKKMDTGLAVLSAAIGTSFEKTRELIWNPERVGPKIGNSIAGIFTNAASILSCGLPFFTEGGPQSIEAAKLLAQAYHPTTGILNLSDGERAYLSAQGRTLKQVKEFFERKAKEEILHSSPGPKMVAAAIPVSALISVLPSLINAMTNFLPEGRAAEIIKTAVSAGQVPVFGPIELLASNLIAALNNSRPQAVTKLSKIGRPVIDTVYAPFHIGKRVVSDGISLALSKPVENPYQVYQDILEALQPQGKSS